MSLETQIAALVTAANNLTAAVNGKMTEIDQKVDDAVVSVPGTVKSYLENRISYYVDSVNGNDANDGLSWAKAKRTLKAAVEGVGFRRYAYILLSKNTHFMSSSISQPDGSNIIIYGDITPYANIVEADRDQWVIRRPDYADGLPGTGDCQYVLGADATVSVRGLRLNYGNVPHRPVHWASFFKVLSHAYVNFGGAKVEARDGNNVVNVELGSCTFTATYSKFDALAGTNVGILRGYSDSSFGFAGGYQNTLTNFVMNGSVPFQSA